MSRASDMAAYVARTQEALEDAYPATLTLGGTAIVCARGPWRSVSNFDDATQTSSESREASVRVRKSLLAAAGRTLIPEATDALLDGALCRVTEVSNGSTADNALHIVCVATHPLAVQA